ncbi:hypothetical protein PR202_ga31024 [Eleusine coracana subsp. coracana]|uniref:Mitotic checkpoint protein n=1 Tax=Eleusine coracana subsp. coracana TaxID=191504 RepID=A0AAV5DP28_ELECO|nr:hypothetical protein PR202_ga31024 [Eleusine coracana subsp. coracana]
MFIYFYIFYDNLGVLFLASGYALSSVEGRVSMEFFDLSDSAQSKKYAFKCHRKSEAGRDTVYPVNAIAFHPIYGTFATGGCDGFVNVWDGTNKKRLYQYSKYAQASLLCHSVRMAIYLLWHPATLTKRERNRMTEPFLAQLSVIGLRKQW